METDVHNGFGNTMALNAVGRPPPPLPSRPAPPPPPRPAASQAPAPEAGGKPPVIEKPVKPGPVNSANNSVRKRPVIEILDARPMSEVGFRDTAPPTTPPRPTPSMPPSRPVALPSRPQSMIEQKAPGEDLANRPLPPRPSGVKPPRPISVNASIITARYSKEKDQLVEPNTDLLAFENDAFGDGDTDVEPQEQPLIDLEADVSQHTGSSNVATTEPSYPDLLTGLNVDPDVIQPDPQLVKPPKRPPSVAMSQLASVMMQGIKQPHIHSDEDDESSPQPNSTKAPQHTTPPSLPTRPPPAKPSRPPPSLPSRAPAKPQSVVRAEPAPVVATPPVDQRPVPSVPPRSHENIPSSSEIADGLSAVCEKSESTSGVHSTESSDSLHKESHGHRSAAMAQLAMVMTGVKKPQHGHEDIPQGVEFDSSSSDHNTSLEEHTGMDKHHDDSFSPLVKDTVEKDLNDSFYSDHDQSITMGKDQEQHEDTPDAHPVVKNSALSSLASVINSSSIAHKQPHIVKDQDIPARQSAPAATKPKDLETSARRGPPPPMKPKPSLKPKPLTKPKPTVSVKPSTLYRSHENVNTAKDDAPENQHMSTVSMPKSSSAMANLAHVMNQGAWHKNAMEKVDDIQLEKQGEHLADDKATVEIQEVNKEAELTIHTDTSTSSVEMKISPVQRKFGNMFFHQNQDHDQRPPIKASWKKRTEPPSTKPVEPSATENENIIEEAPKEKEGSPLMPKKPGPAPMRATYRPTIIKPAARQKTSDAEKAELNNNDQDDDPPVSQKETGGVHKLSARATSMFNLDKSSEDGKDAESKAPPVAMRPKRTPTIIRPPSMSNVSMQSTDKDEAPKEEEAPKPMARVRPNPTPRSGMSAAFSMPNIANIDGKQQPFSVITANDQNRPVHRYNESKEQEEKTSAPTRPGPPSRPRPPSIIGAPQKSSPPHSNKSAPEKSSPPPAIRSGAPVKSGPPPRPAGGPPPRPTSGPTRPSAAPRRASVGSTSSEHSGSQQQPSRGMPPRLPDRPGPGHPLYHYVVSGPHAIAVYDYMSGQQGDLTFKAGDVIELTRRVDDDWLEGRNPAGTGSTSTGIFPTNFVDVIQPPPDGATAGQACSAPAPRRPSSSSSPADTMSGPRCRARYDYDSDQPTDLCFSAGDLIRIKAYEGEEWLVGELGGRTGIFPITFVEIIEDLNQSNVAQKTQQPTHQVAAQRPDNIVVATFDYIGEDGDLNFKAGSEIRVLSAVNEDWLFGELGGATGQFPVTFVDHVPQNLPAYTENKPQVIESAPAPTLSSVGTCVALYDFPGQSSEDLSFSTGETIDIMEEIDADWLKGSIGSRQGTFPRAFVDIKSLKDPSPPVSHHGEAKALFDFSGQTDGDLSFHAGEIIELTEVIDADWMRGEIQGRSGVFPASFVDVIKPCS